MEEICKGAKGYNDINGCQVLLALYSSQSEENKQRSNLEGILVSCLSQYESIKKCKKEPTAWPIPDAIVD